jgi:hypothetical protein
LLVVEDAVQAQGFVLGGSFGREELRLQAVACGAEGWDDLIVMEFRV